MAHMMLAHLFDRIRFSLTFLREPHRWSMAGLAVVLGTVGLILADGFIERIFVDFREGIVRAHFGHLQILPSKESRASETEGQLALAGLRPEAERALQSFPGAIVAARLSFVGLASFGDRTISFIGEGVEPEKERTLSSALVVGDGEALNDERPDEVLVGEGLAASLGASTGDKLILLVTTPGGGINAAELTVAGVFYTATKAYDDRALRLPLATVQRLLRSEKVSRLIAVLPETEASSEAVDSLRSILADKPVVVKHWSELADFYTKTVALFSSQLDIVRGVIVAIVLLSVANTMARNVMERTSEIGTMRALGRRRRDVARLFVAEGFVIGLVGATLGIALGWLLAALVSGIGIPMPPPPGMARGFVGGIAFDAGIAATAFVIALLTATVAALLPALRASRLVIVDALRTGR